MPSGVGSSFANFRVQMNGFELMSQSLLQRADKIPISSGSRPVVISTTVTSDPSGVPNGAHLQADVSTTDHQQSLRNVFQFQRAGGVHDTVVAESKHRRHGRL